MNHEKTVQRQRLRRTRRVRKPLKGNAERPRLSIFRSQKHIYCQLIDDTVGATLAAASTRDKDVRSQVKSTSNKEAASLIGTAIAEKALATGIQLACLDRGPCKYHGRIAAVAEAARAAGLQL